MLPKCKQKSFKRNSESGMSIIGVLVGLSISFIVLYAIGKTTNVMWKNFQYQSEISTLVGQISKINYLMESHLDRGKSCRGTSTEGLRFSPVLKAKSAWVKDLKVVNFGSGTLLALGKKGSTEITSITINQDSPVVISDPPVVSGNLKIIVSRNETAHTSEFTVPFLFKVKLVGGNYVFDECLKETSMAEMCSRLGKRYSAGWCS